MVLGDKTPSVRDFLDKEKKTVSENASSTKWCEVERVEEVAGTYIQTMQKKIENCSWWHAWRQFVHVQNPWLLQSAHNTKEKVE